MARTDEIVRDDVIAELEWSPELTNPSAIGVSVDNGVVTLSGSMDSYLEKLAAERAAWRVLGVEAVVQSIEVKLPLERDDTEIARAVRNSLDLDASIHSGGIQVKVENCWVTLGGTVDRPYQRTKAEIDTSHVYGIKGITNSISVKTGAMPADIKQQIERALTRMAALDAQGIDVTTTDGKVTLSGIVHSWAEKQEAKRAAYSAPGVNLVDDQIRIVSSTGFE